MASSKRLSLSFTSPTSPTSNGPLSPPPVESDEWKRQWESVLARDLIDSRIVSVDAQTTVEDACDKLLSEDIGCLVVRGKQDSYTGVFDFSDVNAFLTLAATRHTIPPEELQEHSRADDIIRAARAGHVPVQLVCDLSEKNPLRILPNDATIISLLEVFSQGTHRVLIRSDTSPTDFLGIVSDRGLLSWVSSYAQQTPSFQYFLANPLRSLSMPSLNIYDSVVAVGADNTVLDAMKLMSEQGVSSVAVMNEGNGTLLSAVSVTDIGKIVVPSQSNQVLTMPLYQFVAQIKAPDGSTDGVDKYPVYSVFPTNDLAYTIQKLLATNAHRLFVLPEQPSGKTSPVIGSITSPNLNKSLSGIVSIVDILSLFARLANISNVDPTRMQRHRRQSSASSHSSNSFPGSAMNASDPSRSRSGSKTDYPRAV